MAKKKASSRSKSAYSSDEEEYEEAEAGAEAEEEEEPGGSGEDKGKGKLLRSVYQDGFIYDPGNKAHQQKFAEYAKKANKKTLQAMADRKIISGYGTSASKSSEDEDEESGGS